MYVRTLNVLWRSW